MCFVDICPYCNGTGERGFPGARCYHCNGSGIISDPDPDEEEYEDDPPWLDYE